MAFKRCLHPKRIFRCIPLPFVITFLALFVCSFFRLPHITIEIRIEEDDDGTENRQGSNGSVYSGYHRIRSQPLQSPDNEHRDTNNAPLDGMPNMGELQKVMGPDGGGQGARGAPIIPTLGAAPALPPEGAIGAPGGTGEAGEETDKLVEAILAGKANQSSLPELHDKDCPWSKYSTQRYKCSLPPDLYTPGQEFDQMLKKTADDQRRIFLASVDSGYIAMALNLLETSFQKHQIHNFLFVCSDLDAKEELKKHNIPCYYYEQDNIKKTEKASRYMTKDFILKTHIKTKIILGALTLNYTVIITDVDIVFLKNPLQYFDCIDCDVEIQSDHTEENSGFYLVRPTQGSIELHNMALRFGTSKTSNQKALKAAFRVMRHNHKIKTKVLSKEQFPCGLYYFEQPKRLFAGDNPCKNCVIVHNNWILGKLAKIYRFKEHLLWTVDQNGYYSNTSTKYLTYDNYLDFGNKTRDTEVATLKIALSLGHILNRVVILPDFTCSKCGHFACKVSSDRRCPLHVHLKVTALDISLPGSYRERMFLFNKKVPSQVKQSVTSPVLISSNHVEIKQTGLTTFTPKDSLKGATTEEIIQWFMQEPYSSKAILKFDSLYHAFAGFGDNAKYKDFKSKLKKAVVKGNYRQY